MKLGIPRALSFYNFYPFWYGFFTDLGIEIVLSDDTTKQTMTEGSSLVVPETCLPIKVYVGHVMNLIEKGIDKIFVPSIQSIAPKIYNCSKIRGLPDLIRNVIKKEFTIIEATLDKSEKKQGLYEFLRESVAPFGITDLKRIKEASKVGWKMYNNFRIMTNSGISYKKALRYAIEDRVIISDQTKSFPISVAVISHGYNLYDEKVSMKIFEKLENLDVRIFTAEHLTIEKMEEGISALEGQLYWANEHEITGAAAHYIQQNQIDGIIAINAFGCGPDSLMLEKVARYSKDNNKPFLNLSIDEHTGEAGFVTRIEAFVDMLYRRKRSKIVKDINIQEESVDSSEEKIQTRITDALEINQ